MTGRVALVGAGPGDPGLLTVRGAELVAEADVVVFDRLVGKGVLALCRSDAELIDVSKKPGDHSIEQEEINELLVAHARAGLKVVRLKGGDPFVFGRGGEEALVLAAAGVPFEIVPGVSSALAGPAAAGVPVTHRALAHSMAVVTGHAQALDDHDWEALARIDTLVVLMGAATTGDVARRLIAAGRSGDTPAIAVQSATLPEQQELRTTLGELVEGLQSAGLAAPVVLVVGPVAALDIRNALVELLA